MRHSRQCYSVFSLFYFPLFSLLVFAASSFAATVKWTGAAGDGLWATSGNWDNNTGPAVTDDVVFPGSLAGTVSVNLGANRTVQSISFGDASGTTLTSVTLTGAFTLQLTPAAAGATTLTSTIAAVNIQNGTAGASTTTGSVIMTANQTWNITGAVTLSFALNGNPATVTLTKNGAGQLTLSADCNRTTGIYNGGTIRMLSQAAIVTSSSTVFFNDGTTLEQTVSTARQWRFSGNATWRLSGGTVNSATSNAVILGNNGTTNNIATNLTIDVPNAADTANLNSAFSNSATVGGTGSCFITDPATGLPGLTTVTTTGAGTVIYNVGAPNTNTRTDWIIGTRFNLVPVPNVATNLNVMGATTNQITVNAGGVFSFNSQGAGANAFNTLPNPIVLNGGTLQTAGVTGGDKIFSGSVSAQTGSTSTINLDDNATATTARNITISGPLAGGGTINISKPSSGGSASTLTLTNSSGSLSGSLSIPVNTNVVTRGLGTLGSPTVLLLGGTVKILSDTPGSSAASIAVGGAFDSTLTVDPITTANSVNVTLAGLSFTSAGRRLSVNSTTGYNLTFNGGGSLTGPCTLDSTINVSIAGSLTGSGAMLTKSGAGALTMSGSNNTFDGGMVVNNGSFFPTGVFASAIAYNTPAVSGVFSPGGTGATNVGTVTCAGLTLASGTASTFDCGSTGNNDKVIIAGTHACNVGGALNIADVGGYSPGTYTLVDAAAGPGTVVDNTTSFTTPPGFATLKSISGNKLIVTVSASGGTWAANATTGNWSLASNWATNALPLSGTSSRLFFPMLSGANNPYTSTNDLAFPNPFVLNILNLNTSTNGNTLAGNPLQFDGTTPAIQQTGSGSFTIQNNLVLNADTAIAGSTPAIGGTGAVTLSGQISGTGGLISNNAGAGVVTLNSGAGNTYQGPTTINTGTLVVSNANGSGTSAGTVTMAGGTTLAGVGRCSGIVILNGASTLAPGAVGAGNIGSIQLGGLTMNNAATVSLDLGAPALHDTVTISGDLLLAGTLNLNNAGGAMAPGTYFNLLSYTGTLNNLNPSLVAPTNFAYQLQTATAGQVNLVVSAAGGTSNWLRTGPGPWTKPVNWDTMPGSSATTALVFPNLGSSYAADNTFSAGFLINTLTITSTGLNSITGNPIAFGGTNPAINENGAGGTFSINAPLALNANTTLQGTGAGTVSISSVISGTGALNVNSAGTFVLANDANSYTGATTINGGTLLVQNPLTPGILNTACALGNTASAISITNGKLQVNPGVAVTSLARPIVFNNSSEFFLQQRGDITPTGGWTINAVTATPAKFRYANALNWGGAFTLPALTATAANALRVELNDGVNNGVGGALNLTGSYPCSVIFAGVPGGNPSAASVATPTNVAKLQLNGNYTQAAGVNALTFENVLQVGATGAGRLVASDITVSNGITVLSGRGTGTNIDASSHETVLPAGKTLTIQSGAAVNMDMGFRQDLTVYGGVFQLGSTILNSGASPATLRFMRSDAAAVPAGGRAFRMLLMGGNITGTGANSILDFQVDTRDGGYVTIDSIATSGTIATFTTTTPHGFVPNDTITVGHDEQGTAAGIAPAPAMAAGTFGNFVCQAGTAGSTIIVNSTAAAGSTSFTTKPVVGIAGVAFNSNCNLVINGGMTLQASADPPGQTNFQGSAKRIQNVLSSARLNAITGSGGFLAPKPTDTALVIPTNTTTWPNGITLQVQHTTTGTDMQLGGAFANNIMVGATPAETAAKLDGNGQTVSSLTGPIAVRGFGVIAGTLSAGANASIWPGITALTSQLNQNEVLQASATSTINLSAGKFKSVIAKAGAIVKQQLNVAAGGVLTLGPASTLSLGVLTGDYGIADIPIIVCGTPTITARFGVTLGLPTGWQVIYRAGGADLPGNLPTVATPADTVVIRTTGGNVTSVTLEAFAATAEGAGVSLTWNAVSEFQNAGFNVYRRSVERSSRSVLFEQTEQELRSTWTRVNSTLIPGRITSPNFKTYRFYDWAAPGAYEYKLESVSLAGARETFAQLAGPVSVDSAALGCGAMSFEGMNAAACGLALERSRARGGEVSSFVVRPLGGKSSSSVQALDFSGAPSIKTLSDVIANARGSRVANGLPPKGRTTNRWFSAMPTRSASSVAAKVVYDKPGVLRIPQSMLPAGFNLDRVTLQREGRNVVPLATSGSDLIVYAPGYQDDYTDKDAIFVRKSNTPTAIGKTARAAQLFDSALQVNVESAASVIAEFHDVYFDFTLRPYNFAPWFSGQYLTDGSTQTFALDTPRAGSGTARLTVRLWSLTSADGVPADHALLVLVNGSPAGQAQWSGGEKIMELSFSLDSGVLAAGKNTIELITPPLAGVSQQISFLHSLTLSCAQALKGAQPSDIYNTGTTPKLFEVSGLSSADAWVVDARYPDRAALAAYESQQQADGTFSLRFMAQPGGSGHYLVVPAGQENTPLSVTKRTLKPIKFTPYLAVGPGQFASSVQPLLLQRAKEGLRGAFEDQEQIFDYYGFGRYGPGAIQNAVRAARPKYLLLLGRTTYDYRNYGGVNVDPLCPTFLVSTTFWSQATSDSMFGDLGRGYPEVAVGRLPVNDANELAGAVHRILSYKGAPASGLRVHAVADRIDLASGDFAAQADRLEQNVPSLAWQRNYLGVTWQTSLEVTAALKDAANGGADTILYVGHGNALSLGNEVPRILDTQTVQEWTGNVVFLQSTCTANWMAKNERGYRSIAIQALTQPQGGICASIGSSTYMRSEVATNFMSQVLRNANSTTRWGDALKNAQRWAQLQSAFGDSFYADLYRTEQLFGDPAMPIQTRTPADAIPASKGQF